MATRDMVSKTALGIACSFLTPCLIVLAFDPFGLWIVIFFAFVPMLIAQYRLMPDSISGLAAGIGVAGLFASQMSAGLADGEVAWYYQLWPVYVAALVWALAQGGKRFHSRTGFRWFLLAFPCTWVAINFLRNLSGVDFLAATWASPAYALYNQPWLLQPLSVVGIFGLELLILVTNFAIAHVVLVALDTRGSAGHAGDPGNRGRGGPIATFVVLLFWIGWSLVLFDEAEPTLRVATVMPVSVLDADEEFRRDIEQTRFAAAQGAKLVVWREAGLKFNPFVEHTEEIAALARETQAYIVVGYRYQSERGHHNEAAVVTPEGEFLGPYGKTHPGTFAGDFSDTGGKFETYATSFGPLATIICYDLDFTDTARSMAALGARMVAVPSADVPGIARSHYTHLVFRAIENRLAMAKADNAFDSAIIDPWGRIIARAINPLSAEDLTRDNPPRLLVADVPLVSGSTLYTRFGDWIGWVALAVALALQLLRLGRKLPTR